MSANGFAEDLEKHGAKHVIVMSGVGDDAGYYLITDPRDHAAIFGYADEKHNVYGIETLPCNDRPLLPAARGIIRRRMAFLGAVGTFGFSPHVVDQNGNQAAFDFASIAAIRNAYGVEKVAVVVDFGGEGVAHTAAIQIGFPVAINVQVRPTGTGALANKKIPNLFLRLGCEDDLSDIPSRSVGFLLSQSTPISPKNASVIARLTKRGGRIKLTAPDNPTTRLQHQYVIDAVRDPKVVTQIPAISNGMNIYTTIINIQ